MRKFWIFALLASATLAASAEGTIMKAFKTEKPYHSIAVGGPIKVFVEQRTEGNIILRTTEKILPLLELKVNNGALTINFKEEFDMKKRADFEKAEVYIPNNGQLREFGAVGCARIVVAPQITAKEVEVECAAAAHIELTKVIADKVNIDAIGASKVTLDVECTSIEAEAAGASAIKLSGKATKGEFDIIGASTLSADNLHCMQLEAEISGASSADMSADMGDVEVSGASNADITCATQLNASASGASTIRYSGNCQVKIENNSGASSIKKR